MRGRSRRLRGLRGRSRSRCGSHRRSRNRRGPRGRSRSRRGSRRRGRSRRGLRGRGRSRRGLRRRSRSLCGLRGRSRSRRGLRRRSRSLCGLRGRSRSRRGLRRRSRSLCGLRGRSRSRRDRVAVPGAVADCVAGAGAAADCLAVSGAGHHQRTVRIAVHIDCQAVGLGHRHVQDRAGRLDRRPHRGRRKPERLSQARRRVVDRSVAAHDPSALNSGAYLRPLTDILTPPVEIQRFKVYNKSGAVPDRRTVAGRARRSTGRSGCRWRCRHGCGRPWRTRGRGPLRPDRGLLGDRRGGQSAPLASPCRRHAKRGHEGYAEHRTPKSRQKTT